MKWFNRVKEGLAKTASNLTKGISLVSRKKIDAITLAELEEILLLADLGAHTAGEIIKKISKAKINKDADEQEIKELMATHILPIIEPVAKVLKFDKKPHVLILCGVNGNGKTTTAGKLASKLIDEGKKVMLVAGDTFRAAATEQLQVWAERCGATFVGGLDQSDPASLAYKAYNQALLENFDVVIIDTAGRLHNKQNLMDELAKIIRVLKKLDDNLPHDCVLVLDATTGQNALNQVETFAKTVNLTGLIITKLDGTAKAGILINIVQRFNLPIFAIGVGESIEDLSDFNAKDFVKALIFN